MSDDTAPDTQAMEEAFAALQEKITDLFDETLTDLIARTEEAVAAVDELLGRGSGTAPDTGDATALPPGVVPAAASAPAPSAGPMVLSGGQGRVVQPAADSVAAMQELTVAVDTVLAELSGTMEERLTALLGGLEALLVEQGLSAEAIEARLGEVRAIVANTVTTEFETANQQLSDIAQTVQGQLSGALKDFVRTGEFSFKKLGNALKQTLLDSVFENTVNPLIDSFVGHWRRQAAAA